MNNIKKLTVKNLRQYCKDTNIKGYSKYNKADLIKFIIEKEKKNVMQKSSLGSLPIPFVKKIKIKTKCIVKKCHNCSNQIQKEEPYISYPNGKYEHLNCLKVMKKYQCSICLENINDNDEFKTHCNHYFHKNCIHTWYEQSPNCPNCRGDIYSILSSDDFIMRMTDKIQKMKKNIAESSDRIYQREQMIKFEKEMMSILKSYLKYYIKHSNSTKETLMNDIYITLDELLQ
jgi:hypothetical protein